MRYYSLLLFAFMACGQNNNTTRSADTPKNASLATPAAQKESSRKIRNNIEVQANGVTVKQAFLTYEDGTLVSEDNVTNVNKKLLLNLVVDGWEAKDGKVQLEASEKLTSDKGDVLLNETELFSKGGLDALTAEDARYLRLNMVITRVMELADYYVVEFKVWNKYTQQFIYGSYRFYIG